MVLVEPNSSKKRRLSMEIPSAKKKVQDKSRQFENKPHFEQFTRQNDYRLLSQNAPTPQMFDMGLNQQTPAAHQNSLKTMSQNLFNNMMENLDWDRAHTIEEEDEDSPEGVLEEHKARKASNIQIGDINGGDDLNKRGETDD